jgi:hypothetical protein
MTAMYIALEGPDGVGKSTVAAALKERLLRCTRPDRTQPDHAPLPNVRIRHFPTQTLAQCAKEDGRALMAEDYLLDMENWLRYRPEPVEYPDAPTHAAQPDTLYILDRWALSTLVYAALRGESIRGSAMITAAWLQRVPLTTFVLMPKDPAALTDPDFGSDNMTADAYDPEAVAKGYSEALAKAFVGGFISRYVPIRVDRAADTPHSTAARIAGWVGFLQARGYEVHHNPPA